MFSRWAGVALCLTVATNAWASGQLQGRITRPDGTPLSGVTVSLSDTGRETLSSENGTWSLGEVPDGRYTLLLSLATFAESVPLVVDGAPLQVDRVLDWNIRYEETVVVYGATRQRERLIETLAAASIIPSTEIARDGGHGLLPKLLQAVPAVEVVQNGLFDFNINMRGLNRALNRRVLVLLDGRDPSGVLLGAQEWAGVSLNPDEIAQIEVIRGPGSALYGANAFNGVVSILSKEPRFNRGGYAQLTFGERNTFGVSSVHAARLSEVWDVRVSGSAVRSDDFYVSRTATLEYPGLTPELVAPVDRTYAASVAFRADRSLDSGLLSFEGGVTRSSGQIFLTGVGRSQTTLVHRPWARTLMQRDRWQVSGYVDGRDGESLSLGANSAQFDRSLKGRGELLVRQDLRDARATVIGGFSAGGDRIDTADDAGRQTILNGRQSGHTTAVFGQIDWKPTSRLTLLAAMRVDESSLFPTQGSPKVGGALSVAPGHTIRASWGRAFQSPTYGELAPRVDLVPPLMLGALEAALAPVTGGIPLGFASVPVLALGNPDLDVEKVDSVEAGYSGMAGRRVLIWGEVYRSRMRNFISGLLPQVGTSLGRINPLYGPYQPPSALNAQQRAILLATLQSVLPPTLFPFMSNDIDGAPIFAAYSFTNFGEVVAKGVDLGVKVFPADQWSVELGYAHFAFDVQTDLPDDPIEANTSPNRWNAAVSYAAPRWSAAARYRWSDAFDWANGIQRGPVPSYGLFDVSGTIQATDRVQLRANAANLFDNDHYEIFGGDLIGRRVVVDAMVRW